MCWRCCWCLCCCCCDNSVTNDDIGPIYSQEPGCLEKGQQLTKTSGGHSVNMQTVNRLSTSRELQELKKTLPKMDAYIYCRPFIDFSQIAEHLFLTGYGGITNENIKYNSIKCIVSVTYETPVYAMDGISFIRVPVADNGKENMYKYFDELSDKIAELVDNNNNTNTVVHCLFGRSRSVTVVLAYLMKSQRLSLDKAFDLVKFNRPVIAVNPGYIRQLAQYERYLLGERLTKLDVIIAKNKRLVSAKELAAKYE
ncbi:dual specificity protein phosphatase 14-like [Oppia nitens]|uniref:dual specificity protein phosphatase 14-like n=1 Tax=Oppia nitens TaxID=1686743 RepID=UPI0023D98769|nr:dual specificity protein phosphatase 14-like [Oppia nitens]